ncbi:MAG: DUF6798 domain-containing protein, partial [Patescibacteria group bacterium]
FAVGALPFIFTIPRRFSVTSASVPKEIVDFRISYLYPPSLDGLRQWFRQWFIIPAVLGVLGFLVQVFGVGLRRRDLQLLGFFAFSLLLSSLAYLLPVTGSLFSVNTLRPMRLSVHFFTVFFVYSAVFFAWVLRLKPKVLRLFSVVLLPFFMFSQFDVLNAYVFHLPVKTFEKLTYSSDEASDGSQEVENKKNTEEVAESDQNTEVADKDSGLDISDESVGESNKVSKKEVSKNKESADNKSFDFRKMVGPQDDWEAFFALCDWFNKNTPVDSLVLIPPQGFGLFRTFSHRAIFVCAKDGGIGCFSSKHAQIWYRRYKQVLELYQSGMTGDFISLAERENIDYAVLADARPLSLPLLFSAGPFRVYQL